MSPLITLGMNESCDIVSFKVVSPTLDILHSPPPSIIEAHDSATKKGTFSVF